MDAPYYNGDVGDWPSVEERCDLCRVELCADEIDEGRCRRCTAEHAELQAEHERHDKDAA